MIKRCDKGAGIIILNKRACNVYLNSHIEDENGTRRPYDTKVDKFAIDNAKNQLNNLLQEAFDNSLITKKRIYCNEP